MATKSAEQIKNEITVARAELGRLVEAYQDGETGRATVAQIDALSDQVDRLILDYKDALKAEKTRDERNRLTTMFRGGGGSAPTGDGGRQRRHTGSFSGAILEAGWSLDNPSVTVNLFDVYNLQAVSGVDLSGGGTTSADYRRRPLPDIAALGQDRRFLWPLLPTQDIQDDTSIDDFRQTGTRTVTGSVERAIDATTDKATLAVAIEHVNTAVKQVAVTVDEVPLAVLRSVRGLETFLNTEMRDQLDAAIDAHVVTEIAAATPPNGNTGADLFAQVRTAIGAMRGLGSSPDLVVLNNTDAVALDLLQDNEARYFGPGPLGAGFPALWNLGVVEHVGSAVPMLIDRQRLGVLYLGTMRFEADPYSNFKKNLVTLRVEANVLMHVRDANGAYTIEA